MQKEKITEEDLPITGRTVEVESLYDPTRNKKQLEFHEAPEMYKLFGGAMGGGKTAALINECEALCYEYPGNFGLLLRKTFPSFRNTVLPQLEKFTPKEAVYSWNETAKRIFFINGSVLLYGGLGDSRDDWEKFMSGEYGFIALDQAEQFTEEDFIMLSTRLRLNIPNIRYFFLLSCNPNIGWIKERFLEKTIDEHVFIPSLPEDNKENLPPNYISNMKEILTPVLYEALMKGNWDAVGEPDNVYAYTAIRAAMKRRAKSSFPYEVGVDVARGERHTADQTVITLREGLHVVIYNEAKGHDLMKTAGKTWECCTEEILPKWYKELSNFKDHHNKITIKVDADGLGGGVVDRLKEQKREKSDIFTKYVLSKVSKAEREALVKEGFKVYIKIVEIHGSATPKDPVKFKNLRAEIHWGLRELLNLLSLPDNRELLTQLMSIKYGVDSAGRIFIVPKDKIKQTLGRSPDTAESVIYSLADVKPVSDPRITRL